MAPRKIIINTDPGIDDAMAVLMAFQSPDVEVIGLTTTFGNTSTSTATYNSLHLVELAGHGDVPVVEGDHKGLRGDPVRLADFVHGVDGLGNTNQRAPGGKAIEQDAADFIIEKVTDFPGQVSIVELGPLTNIARAIQKDSEFVKKVDEIWVLGGSFFASGNVNPATEANIMGDPEAADIVFTSGAKVIIIGLNVTTQVIMTDDDIQHVRKLSVNYGEYIHDITRYYLEWYKKSDRLNGIYLHDPTCMAGFVDPSLFSFLEGVVRVETEGICRGLTILDQGLKNWNGANPWVGLPKCKVALGVNAEGVLALVKKLLIG